MEPLVGAFGIIVVAIVSGMVTLMVAKRAKSGKIDTSEAAKLWDEGTTMRLELRKEVESLKSQLAEAITAVTDLNREIKFSRRETELAREEARKSREETKKLMEQIESVKDEVKTSNALTIANLADNTETRRILELLPEDRSTAEKQHIDTAGERLPESQRPTVPADSEGGSDE